MNTSFKHLMIGLPESGKTTFLAALWHSLKMSASLPISISVLPAERDYLNTIESRWLNGEAQIHNQTDSIELVALQVMDRDGTAQSVLSLPDPSGELYLHNWIERRWSAQFDEMVRSATGVMIFVNAARATVPVTIGDVNAAAGGISTADEEIEVVEFDSRDVPEQVILVDQLQCILGAPCWRPALRICVVISAWDLVDGPDNTLPAKWLSEQQPLLSQFLESNAASCAVRVFGVSAQGCDFGDSVARAAILAEPNPIDRIRVVGSNGSAMDITAPIQWIVASRTVAGVAP